DECIAAAAAIAIEDLPSIGAQLKTEAGQAPDKIAMVFEDQSITYGALHKRTNRIARGLEAKGVKLGDFVTVALPNSIAFIEACYGVWKVGAVPQPVSNRLPLAELQAIVELANPPVVVNNVLLDCGKPVVSIEDL